MGELITKKVALVTGSTKGIGLEIAKSLLEEGYIVIGNSRVEDVKAKTVFEMLMAVSKDYSYIPGDITIELSARKVIERIINKYGRLDILVNNVGGSMRKPFIRSTEEEYQDIFKRNLAGTIYCSKYALKQMIANRYGRIVNISSIAGTNALAMEVLYSAAKAGINGFTKAIAKEYGSKGITCNAIAPGVIKTENSNEDFNDIRLQIPAREIGKTRDVASLSTFLCSEEAAYINGAIIKADGGLFI